MITSPRSSSRMLGRVSVRLGFLPETQKQYTGSSDLGSNRELVDLRRLGERADLFFALHVARFVEERRRIDQLGLRERFANLFPRAVEDRAFRRARPFDFAETGDADAAAFHVQFF